MSTIAAIHLITANSRVGSPVLAASVLIFGDKKAREDYVVSNWLELLEEEGDDIFSESNRDHILFLINAGAEVIDPSMIASRVTGVQARHLTAATIWQNHYESHVSHYAYLFALSNQKRDVMLKGFNMDGFCLNAANRFVGEHERNVPTGASSPEAGLFYLKELYINAKRLLGHDIDSDGVKILKEHAPALAPQLPPQLPKVPLTPPAAAPKMPPMPGAPKLPPLPGQ